MIKVESILKWKVEGPILKKLKMIRSQILNKNEDAVAIPDSELHITLASGEGWRSIRRQAKASDFDEPEFKIDVEPTYNTIERGGNKSWYVKMKDQQNWKEYVMDLLQGTHDPKRVYHISLANLTGKVNDSVSIVEQFKDKYKKVNSSRRVKRYKDYKNIFEREHRAREQWRGIQEEITKKDLNQIEKYADKLFAAVGIDVEFTRHFLDRANDARNRKPISSAELVGLFRRTYKKHGKKIPYLGPKAQAVIKDMKTDINVPFVLNINSSGMIDLIAKTIMRKQNFKTSNRELAI